MRAEARYRGRSKCAPKHAKRSRTVPVACDDGRFPLDVCGPAIPRGKIMELTGGRVLDNLRPFFWRKCPQSLVVPLRPKPVGALNVIPIA
jgi:hypothetical protein